MTIGEANADIVRSGRRGDGKVHRVYGLTVAGQRTTVYHTAHPDGTRRQADDNTVLVPHSIATHGIDVQCPLSVCICHRVDEAHGRDVDGAVRVHVHRNSTSAIERS